MPPRAKRPRLRAAGHARRRPRPARIAISSQRPGVRVAPDCLRRLIQFVASQEGFRLGEIDLAVVGCGEMTGLNRQYLHHGWSTDALCFDLSDDESTGLSAQLVVSGDAAIRQGPLHGHSPREELMIYVIHGLLHLMNHEDGSVRGAARMHARQDQLLALFLKRR